MFNEVRQQQIIFSTIGGIAGYLLGGFDALMSTLIVFVITDYFTGVLAAVAEHRLSSAVGFKGIAKKIAIFCLVAVANLIDINIIGTGTALRTATIFFYLSNEGISILENCVRVGLDVPQTIVDILEQLKESGRK